MSRLLSLNARMAYEQGVSSDEVEVVLIRFRSPDLSQTIRVSTDPTERLSIDPIEYGTRSTWLGSNPSTQPFKFVLAAAQLPDDSEDGAEGTTRLVFDLVDPSLIELLRSFSGRAPEDLAVVLASTPDLIEFELRDMLMIGAESENGQLVMTITANPVAEELFPAPRMTRSRFPGLFA
jgi:hypothetical protein